MKNRLDKLEASQTEESRETERKKARYLGWLSYRRREELHHPDAKHTRDCIELWHLQFRIGDEKNVGELVDRTASTGPMVQRSLDRQRDEERDRNIIEREVCRAIYQGYEGVEHLECPEEWEASFIAGEKLLEAFEAVPDEAFAECLLRLEEARKKGSDGAEENMSTELWHLAASDEEWEACLGPEPQLLSVKEQHRRILEAVADAFYGEKAYRVGLILDRLR